MNFAFVCYLCIGVLYIYLHVIKNKIEIIIISRFGCYGCPDLQAQG